MMEDSPVRSGMIVGLGADDAGAELKNQLVRELSGLPGITVRDFGVASADDAEPYPQVGLRVAEAVAKQDLDRAILVCGTGIGMAITANKVPGVYAGVAHDAYSAAKARTSNNTQVLALGARVVAPELAATLVDIWLRSEFGGGASARKVGKIEQAEQQVTRKRPKATPR
jgi:ribose 5-phosphate isomerase B